MFSADGRATIDRKSLEAKADDIDATIKRLQALSNGLRHAAVCPASNHSECPTTWRQPARPCAESCAHAASSRGPAPAPGDLNPHSVAKGTTARRSGPSIGNLTSTHRTPPHENAHIQTSVRCHHVGHRTRRHRRPRCGLSTRVGCRPGWQAPGHQHLVSEPIDGSARDDGPHEEIRKQHRERCPNPHWRRS